MQGQEYLRVGHFDGGRGKGIAGHEPPAGVVRRDRIGDHPGLGQPWPPRGNVVHRQAVPGIPGERAPEQQHRQAQGAHGQL